MYPSRILILRRPRQFDFRKRYFMTFANYADEEAAKMWAIALAQQQQAGNCEGAPRGNNHS
jgi:hypothetical protein